MKLDYTESEVDMVARKLLELLEAGPTATMVGLSGDLGAGKTTLVQAIAKSLGVTEVVTSPTFVIAKYYDTKNSTFTKLIHIDAYRIEDPTELTTLGWEEMKAQPRTLISIEWPERIDPILSKDMHRFQIDHQGEIRRIHTI